MTLILYDTLSRSLRAFQPIDPSEVRLYCCGPTVYNFAHIGNLRTYIFEDLLRRVLEFNGFKVRHVVNITDVGHLTSDADEGEDKMEAGSRRTGETVREIAARFTRAFQEDWASLNLREPSLWCKATDHIAEQIEFIRCIEATGSTYIIEDGVYFDTSRQPNYGFLARLKPEQLRAGARVDVGAKRRPTDFALWKFSPKGAKRQMEWQSPWGVGFPGWHIECSAMATKYLGPFFDIHCGGEDHIPVHHTNEIAQTEACFGTHLANYWLHGAFLQVNSEKMAKSSGDFLRMASLTERGHDPMAFRYLCLTAHYRGPLSFTWEALSAASVGLSRLRTAYAACPSGGEPDTALIDAFNQDLNEDLNLPKALAETWNVIRSDRNPSSKLATLNVFDEVLGLRLKEWRPAEVEVGDEIRELAAARDRARRERRWSEADRLRTEINTRGYTVADTPDGPILNRK